MTKMRKLSKEEVAAIMEPKPRSERAAERKRIIEEYKQFLLSLEPGEGGEIIPDEGENRQTIKNRLRRAAKEVGVQLEFKRKRGKIIFRVHRDSEAS